MLAKSISSETWFIYDHFVNKGAKNEKSKFKSISNQGHHGNTYGS